MHGAVQNRLVFVSPWFLAEGRNSSNHIDKKSKIDQVILVKIGIILGTKDPEVVFNAFRLGTLALRNGHRVWIFLVNHGVEIEDIETTAFNIREQIFLFTKKEGEIYTCVTSMKAHNRKETGVCKPHSQDDLLALVTSSEKVLSFG